ncbi:hypothetical protein WR25_12019 [Diploscapter pachys]|uniref:Uncharacterized protein n=1 Tax=Diploscapter pachys TaxID=2018661 RepID=A0A2A2M3E4_9BILA|nr:hypothetical protein WR25_12019 [Diploscapter pachys]
MSNAARGPARDDSEGDSKEPLDLPRFLHRQNNHGPRTKSGVTWYLGQAAQVPKLTVRRASDPLHQSCTPPAGESKGIVRTAHLLTPRDRLAGTACPTSFVTPDLFRGDVVLGVNAAAPTNRRCVGLRQCRFQARPFLTATASHS